MSPKRVSRKRRPARAKKSQASDMRRGGKFWYMAAAVAIIVGLAFYYIPAEQPQEVTVTEKEFVKGSDPMFDYETTRYPASASVVTADEFGGTQIGVAVDTDSVKFGSIPAGESVGKKVINVHNLKDTEAKIYVSAGGDISRFVKFGRDEFVLGPGERVEVDAMFYAGGAQLGDYSGYIEVVAKKPKSEFAKIFW